MAGLGLQKTIAELRTITSKPQSEKKKYNKVDYFSTPLRRSNRLKGNTPPELDLRRSGRLNEKSCYSAPPAKSIFLCLFSPFFESDCGFWHKNDVYFLYFVLYCFQGNWDFSKEEMLKMILRRDLLMHLC